jgi:ABC-2 type transport system ATP-binding protein
MIEVKGLTKYYGDKPGVLDLSFCIESGEAVGLLGPNGAGKTTILKMLASQMLPTAGSITIEGVDAVADPREAARRTGFLPELPPVYGDMDVADYLMFFAGARGIPARKRQAHVREIMGLTAIDHVKGRLIRNLSKGYRQRVGLAQALIGFPPVLILDEPTVGLDPKQITEVRDLIKGLAQEHTVILSSHILPEVMSICTRVLIISGGRLTLEDTIANLEQGGRMFAIRVKGPAHQVAEVLAGAPGVTEVRPMEGEAALAEGDSRFMVTGETGPAVREAIFRRLAANDLPILELRSVGNTLEEIFLEATA